MRGQWAPAEVGFAVDLRGTVYSPGRTDDPAARTFLEENDRFLSNRENVEVYSSLNSQALVAKFVPMQNDSVSNFDNANAGLKTLTQPVLEMPTAPAGAMEALTRSNQLPAATLDESTAAPKSSLSSSVSVSATQTAAPLVTPDEADAGKDMAFAQDKLQGKMTVLKHAMAGNAKARTPLAESKTGRHGRRRAGAHGASRSGCRRRFGTSHHGSGKFGFVGGGRSGHRRGGTAGEQAE